MSDGRIVPQSDRLVVLEQAPEVIYVERERLPQDAYETTIIQGGDQRRLSPNALLALVLGFLLVAGLVYTMATSRDVTSATDDLNVSIDVASPSLPAVTVPAVEVATSPAVVERRVIETQKIEPSAQEADPSIGADEPLEPVEPTQTQ